MLVSPVRMGEQLLKIAPGARNVIGEAVEGELRLHTLSTEQYHRMIEEGILDEDTGTELLDGVLVRKDRGDPGGDPMTVGEAHAYVVRQLAYLSLRLDAARMHLQTQQPLVIAERGDPEPDAAIVLQPLTSTAKAHAADVSCIIEVAGTSLERDRTTKLRHYASGGIPQYLILNLTDHTAEEYLEPDPAAGIYARTTRHPFAATLQLHLSGEDRLEVRLEQLFPPP